MKRVAGVSLLEALLVLVIAAALIYMSLRMYYGYKRDADIYQLKSVVNSIFRGMGNFYRAECYGNVNPTTGQSLPGSGLLRSASPPNPYPINLQTDLVNFGYIDKKDLVLTPIIDTSVGNNGFIAQFNQYTQTLQKGTISPKQTGTVIMWKAQVAVKVRDAAQNTLYLTLLDGDCLSTLGSGSGGPTVLPCPGDPNGTYVVWERMANLAGANLESTQPTWVSIPSVQQFTNIYRTYGDDYLLNVGHTTEVQYYYCGGG